MSSLDYIIPDSRALAVMPDQKSKTVSADL